MPVSWDQESYKKIVLAAVNTGQLSITSDAIVAELQQTISPEINKKALSNFITRLKKAEKEGKLGEGTDAGKAASSEKKTTSTTKTPGTKRGRATIDKSEEDVKANGEVQGDGNPPADEKFVDEEKPKAKKIKAEKTKAKAIKVEADDDGYDNGGD